MLYVFSNLQFKVLLVENLQAISTPSDDSMLSSLYTILSLSCSIKKKLFKIVITFFLVRQYTEYLFDEMSSPSKRRDMDVMKL